MVNKILSFACLAGGLSFAMQASATHPNTHLAPPACPSGCKVVEEIAYKEVCRDVCKVVPETKKIKKWVYSCKDDPFCIPTGGPNACGLKGCKGCDKCTDLGCPSCKGPYARNRLVKREITVEEVCTTKCVVEKVTEVVPYKVYRIVPCDASSASPGGPVSPGVIIPPATTPMPPATSKTSGEASPIFAAPLFSPASR